MMIRVDFQIIKNKNDDSKVFLPVDYRSGFMSIIKSVTQSESSICYDIYFGHRVVKPYTFAVYFGKNSTIKNEYIFFNGHIQFNFKTNSKGILLWLYNHLYREKKFPLYNLVVEVKNINVIKEKIIENNKIIFKTLSPLLVRSHENPNHYLCPKCENFDGDEKFYEAFKFNIKELLRNLNIEYNEVKFTPIRMKKITIKHMGMIFPAGAGIFQLDGIPEVLNLINQIGLGSRRTQGFGMVEVVK